MNRVEEFVKNHYLTMTQKEMGEALGISASNIEYYIRKNNWYTKKNIFSQEAVQFMKDNYKTMSYKDIAKHLGLSERQVRGKLNYLGFTKLRKFNKHYFHHIDTEIKAYFVGFLFADGWVLFDTEKRMYELGFQLQSGDKYILDKLNDELGGVHKIYHENPTVKNIGGIIAHGGHQDTLRVYSRDIVEDLISLGVTQRKSTKDICPTVPEEYFFDFLRGYIDGDGCYWEFKNHYYMHITCASEKVLLTIQSKLEQYDIHTRVYFECEKKYRLMCINISEMEKLISKLYYDENVFCLTRKREKIESYLGSAV